MDDRLLKTAYGIDLSDRHVTLVRVRGRGAPEVLASGAPGRVPEGFARQIANEVAAGRATCVAAAGCHESVLRRVSAPFSQAERALRVFPSLLDVQLPFPLEQCAVAFTDLEANGSGGTDALAFAARREDVQRVLQRCADAGADPVVIDHEGLALWTESFRAVPAATPEDGRIVLQIGPAHSTLVYGRGRRMLGAHGARMGTADAGDAAARAKAMAARVKTWLQAQTSLTLSARTCWIVTGPGAADAAFLAALRAECPANELRVTDEPATYLARALARRGTNGEALACNLRTGPQEHPQVRRLAAAGGRRRVWFALVAACLLCLVNLAALWWAGQRNDRLQQEIQRQAAQLAGAPAPRGQETLVVQRALDQQRVTYRPFQRVARPGASATLSALLRVLGTNGAAIAGLQVEADSFRLEAGEASAELGAWWTSFIDGDADARKALLERTPAGSAGPRKRRRRRPSRGADSPAPDDGG